MSWMTNEDVDFLMENCSEIFGFSDMEYVDEGYLNKLTMGFKIKPHQSLDVTLKKHKYQGYLDLINKTHDIGDLKYIRNDINIGNNTITKIRDRIDKCNKLGDCKETKNYYKGIKTKYIDKGITSKDCDLTLKWFNETCQPAINKRMKSLKSGK